MEKISDQGRLRPWMGFVLFTVFMLFFVFICSPLEINLGITGLVITELSFLAIAVVYCLIRKVKLKEVFPIKKVKVREVIGCILLILGVFPFSIIAVAITALIFPASTKEVGELSSFIYGSMSYPVAILIVALLPAICEEAIHRGAILSNFRGIKHDWIIVVLMGVFFGINHMSVLRFLTTMFLGMVLSYVVVKKNNILLSMIMHFTNNLISVSLGYLSGQAGSVDVSAVDYKTTLGTYLVIGFAGPILITLGLMLLKPESHKKIRFLYAGILAAVMLASGIGISFANAAKTTLVNSTISYEVTLDAKDCVIGEFDVEEDRPAAVAAILANAEEGYMIRIDGDSGSNIINAEVPEGAMRMIAYNVELAPDHYVVTLVPDEDAVGEHPIVEIRIQ